MIVRFLLCEVDDDFLTANLGARLIALRKPDGKIRPVACASVLRRLAAKTACRVYREEVRAACGSHQYAVGKKQGAKRSIKPSLLFLLPILPEFS